MQTLEAAILPIAILALAMSLLTQWIDYLKSSREQSTQQARKSAHRNQPKP